MAKKNGEKITIDQLAVIINKGFDGQMAYMEKKFEQVDEKFDEKFTQVATKEQVKNIEKRLNSMDEKLKKIDGIETRILDIENVLNMPALKK